MTCAEAEELVGAYALDALPSDEAAQFRAHAVTCREHATKAAELRAVASALPASVDAMPPPASLRSRLLDAVAREPQLTTTSAPRRIETAPSGTARTTAATPVGAASGPWRNARPLQAWAALAAAIIAGLLAWNIGLQSGNDDGDRFSAANATSITALEAHNAGGTGTALYFADEDTIVLVADGIGQLDSSRTYQLWSTDSAEPVSLGTMLPDDEGRMRSIVPLGAVGGSVGTIAITVEPAGGSEQPTTDPVFTADLRS
jgi:anti-sigma-K factor RskA